MIWLFTPTKTASWFDIREFEFNNRWEPIHFRWLKVIEYSKSLNSLPRFKPNTICKKWEWIDQFRQYSWFTWDHFLWWEVFANWHSIFRITDDQTKLF
jgi:hypothetical protein